jgi:hypothetical protein
METRKNKYEERRGGSR